MDNIEEIFKAATGADLDQEMAAAGEMLDKLAAEQDIDLSKLSSDDIAELMVDLMPDAIKEAAAAALKVAEDGDAPPFPPKKDEKPEDKKDEKPADKKDEEPKGKEASAPTPPPAGLPEAPTYADVSRELGKVAAAEKIDLDQLSREQYHELYDKVAQQLASPEYQAEKQAAVEQQAKLAEADELGRTMARAFWDENQKLAAKAPSGKGVMDTLRGAITTAKGKEKELSRGIGKHLAAGAKAKDQLSTGRKALGGAAAAGVVGAGAAGAAMASRKKEALDTAAMERARAIVSEQGFNPDTGEKVASVDEPTADEVEKRAHEILKEKGWLEG